MRDNIIMLQRSIKSSNVPARKNQSTAWCRNTVVNRHTIIEFTTERGKKQINRQTNQKSDNQIPQNTFIDPWKRKTIILTTKCDKQMK